MNNAARDRMSGLVGFLGGVRRGVIAGDRVDRQQQAESEKIDQRVALRPDTAAGVAGIVGEGPQPAPVMRRREGETSRDQRRRRAKNDVARPVGEQSRQPDAEMVDQRLNGRDHADEDDDLPGCPGHADQRPECAGEEEGRADIDGAHHGDETEQVEPCRHPAGEAVAENRSPMIEPARGRVGRGDLRHRDSEDGGDAASHDPTDARPRAADR